MERGKGVEGEGEGGFLCGCVWVCWRIVVAMALALALAMALAMAMVLGKLQKRGGEEGRELSSGNVGGFVKGSYVSYVALQGTKVPRCRVR